MHKRHHDTLDGNFEPAPPRKRRCTFSTVTLVRVVGTNADEHLETSPKNRPSSSENLPHLFASWDVDVELELVEPTLESLAPSSKPCYYDVAVETKTVDGPALISQLTSDVILGVLNGKISNLVTMLAFFRTSHMQSESGRRKSSGLELSTLAGVYSKIQVLIERILEDGIVYLLPSTVRIHAGCLHLLEALQHGLHKIVLGIALQSHVPKEEEEGAVFIRDPISNEDPPNEQQQQQQAVFICDRHK